MSDRNQTPNQLDHATARIITELAAALLPHLKDTVSAELARTVKSMSSGVDKEIEETLSSLQRLRALLEGMADTLDSAQNSASLLSDKLLPLLRACETLNVMANKLEQLTVEPDKTMRTGETPETNELLRSLERALSNWEGILKANGRAQTHELGEFSVEVEEQVGWMKSAMPDIVRDIVGKTLSSRLEEWTRISGENVRTLEMRLTRLEKIGKIILGGGIVFIVVLVTLYLK